MIGVAQRTSSSTEVCTGLAEALILRIIERFLGGVEAALTSADDLATGWEAAVLSALRAAEMDPVLSTVLTGAAHRHDPSGAYSVQASTGSAGAGTIADDCDGAQQGDSR
jgi:hypothetical protein